MIRNILTLIFILILASSLRLYGLNWDQGHKLHPDERAIIMNVTNPDFHWPRSAGEWQLIFTPQSPLNPHWFPYGSFPLYLLKLAGNLTANFDPAFATYDKINLLGRAMSALFDVGTVFLVFLIARRLTQKTPPALLAAFFYATAVLPIQLSHFYTVDIQLTFFVTLVLYLCLRHNYVLLGLATGLAFATKVSSLPILVPIFISFFPFFKQPRKLILNLGSWTLISCATFVAVMPYAIIDFSTFYRQVKEQSAMTRDAFTFPYTLQFVGNTPYLYPLKNIFLWGLGPVLATFAFAGVVYALYLAFRSRSLQLAILLVYLFVFFAIVGGFAVGFIRYMAPIYPLFAIFAAIFVTHLFRFISQPKLKLVVTSILLLANSVWPASFMYIYTQPNPRVIATKWINHNIPPGTILAREHWDDGLPLYGHHELNPELPMYEPDSPKKWDTINSILNRVDYYIIASHRLYVPLMKLTNCSKLPLNRCYPKTTDFYTQLFAGNLAFIKVAEFSLYPTIPFTNISINDFSSDEIFTVYDHPKIMIFQKIRPYDPF
jgi:4-amino-4-deoxy-L-arabinose transferase-like glycosyltransferase